MNSIDFDIDLNFGSQQVEDIINTEVLEQYAPTENPKDLDRIIQKDIEIFTNFCNYLNKDNRNKNEINILEDYRVLERNILVNRGVFYSESLVEVFRMYNELKNTSLLRVNNRSFTGRYMLPIKLIDGRVFTFLGYNYNPEGSDTKYEMPNQKWINQYNLIGNLESINMYSGSIIYVTEGYFDAVTLNSQWHVKSVCIFGSRLSLKQRSILNILKGLGHVLIYVPDKDISGQSVVKDNIWDFIWNLPTKSNSNIKDVNDYVQSYYVEKYNSIKKVDLLGKGKIDIPIFKPNDLQLKLKLNDNILKYSKYVK